MKFIKYHIRIFFFIFLILFFILVCFISVRLNQNKKSDLSHNSDVGTFNIEKESSLLKEVDEHTIDKVYVDIKGAVVHPGVYEVASDKKVMDVVLLAGGLAENADTSMINLAKNVFNEMVVIIYTKDEIMNATKPNEIIKYVDKECICPEIKNDGCLYQTDISTDKGSDEKSSLVNINLASVEELQSLSGIGLSKAEAIVHYREENGNFDSIDDIKNVSGIGESLFEKIKNFITV